MAKIENIRKLLINLAKDLIDQVKFDNDDKYLKKLLDTMNGVKKNVEISNDINDKDRDKIRNVIIPLINIIKKILLIQYDLKHSLELLRYEIEYQFDMKLLLNENDN